MKIILDHIEKDYFHEAWKEYERTISRSSELVKAIVKLADNYSVYQYCLNEKSLGNISVDIHKIYLDCQTRIDMYIHKINEEINKRRKK